VLTGAVIVGEILVFGADPDAIPSMRAANPGLPLAIWDQTVATTSVRGHAIEGFFRTTRPHPRMPGRFLHEHVMTRPDGIGLLRLTMGNAENAENVV